MEEGNNSIIPNTTSYMESFVEYAQNLDTQGYNISSFDLLDVISTSVSEDKKTKKQMDEEKKKKGDKNNLLFSNKLRESILDKFLDFCEASSEMTEKFLNSNLKELETADLYRVTKSRDSEEPYFLLQNNAGKQFYARFITTITLSKEHENIDNLRKYILTEHARVFSINHPNVLPLIG